MQLRTEIQIDRQTKRLTEKQIYGQTDEQTDLQTGMIAHIYPERRNENGRSALYKSTFIIQLL